MRKYIAFALALFCLFLTADKTPLNNKTPIDKIEKGSNDAGLTEPPELTVICGKNSVEALRGTTAWMYQNANGTNTAIASDSIHPLQAKEYMQPLDLIPTPVSYVDPTKAYLLWNIVPDMVSVCCWNEKYWEQTTAESEEIAVNSLIIDSNIQTAPSFSFELKDGNYIYEVVAEWNSDEKYGGTAYYSFYTTKPNMELQSIG